MLRPLDLDEARAVVERLPPGAAVAVCFLHSYANPDHERAVAKLVREGSDGEGRRAGFVTASSEVLPEFREYERFNTTALNAYIGPSSTATWPGSRRPSPSGATGAPCSS